MPAYPLFVETCLLTRQGGGTSIEGNLQSGALTRNMQHIDHSLSIVTHPIGERYCDRLAPLRLQNVNQLSDKLYEPSALEPLRWRFSTIARRVPGRTKRREQIAAPLLIT